MIDILHAFAAGIAFVVGVTVGAVLCQIASRAQRRQFAEDWKQSQDRIDARLRGSLLCHERIATALETITETKSEDLKSS